MITHAKYLGVIIDKHFNWTEHVNMITAKANSVRGILQRNLCKCPSHVKSSSYVTYVRPILDYASTMWSPYHQHNEVYKPLNKVNEGANGTRYNSQLQHCVGH